MWFWGSKTGLQCVFVEAAGEGGLQPPPVHIPLARVQFDAMLPAFYSAECVLSGDPTHGTVMQQMTPLKPVPSGGDLIPYSLLGARDGKNSSFSIDAYISEPGGSVLIGLHGQAFQDDASVTQCEYVYSAVSCCSWCRDQDLDIGLVVEVEKRLLLR